MKRTLLVGGLIALTTQMAVAQQTDSIKVRQLQEVSVVGTRAGLKTPMSYSNIKKEELRKVNLGQDVPYLLQLQPSVVATSDAGTGIGYTGIRVRGVDASGTNVTANGVPINDSESQGVFWVNMPDLTSSVEEMQLQRGIGTSSNGAGSFGASLNMRTSNLSTKAYAEVGASAGSYNTFRRNVRLGTGTIAGHWAVDARLSKITSDGYIDRGTVDLVSYFVQAGYFNNRTVLKFITFGGKEVTGIAWNGIEKWQEELYGRRYNSAGDIYENGKRYYHNTDNYNQRHNHLILTQGLGDYWTLNLTGHYTAGFGFTDEYRTGRKPTEYGLKLYTAPDKKGKLKEIKRSLIRRKYLDNDFYGLIGNLNYKRQRVDLTLGASGNYYKGLHYGEIRFMEAGFPDFVDPTAHYYDSYGKKLDLSLYTKLSYQLTEGLSAFVDLQYRHLNYRVAGTNDAYSESGGALQQLNVDKDFHFFNPKAGLFYRFAERHHAYASVAIAHREPTRKMYTDGSDPRPEQMTDFELGYGYTSERFALKANAYYMKYSDQIIATGKLGDVGESLMENVPDSHRLGLELSLGYEPIKAIRLDASLALSDNRIKSYTYYVDETPFKAENSKIGFSPSIVASGGLTFRGIKHLELALTAQHVGMQHLDNSGSLDRTMPAYTVANLRAGYDIPVRGFVKGWNLSLQVNNLFNAKYYSNAWSYAYLDGGKQVSGIGYYPQAPINFLVGTTLTF